MHARISVRTEATKYMVMYLPCLPMRCLQARHARTVPPDVRQVIWSQSVLYVCNACAPLEEEEWAGVVVREKRHPTR